MQFIGHIWVSKPGLSVLPGAVGTMDACTSRAAHRIPMVMPVSLSPDMISPDMVIQDDVASCTDSNTSSTSESDNEKAAVVNVGKDEDLTLAVRNQKRSKKDATKPVRETRVASTRSKVNTETDAQRRT